MQIEIPMSEFVQINVPRLATLATRLWDLGLEN